MAREDAEACAVCTETNELSGIVVGERQLYLCPRHAKKLGEHAPRTFDDLAALFSPSALDRRREIDRRRIDRRMFPPRPELRRRNFGRRD